MLLETAEVLWTARYDYDPGWVLKVHSHEFFQAVYLVAGAGTLTLDGTQYPLEPCHVFVASPGVTHGLKASTRVRTLDMKFNVRNRALASALLKISGTIERVPSQDLRKAESMSAFFIIPARAKKSLMNIFADHPPLEQRLAALERLETQLQGTA